MKASLYLACLAHAWLGLASFAIAQPAPLFDALDTSAPVPYRVLVGEDVDGFVPTDVELCIWALGDWSRASGGELQFVETDDQAVLIEIHFVAAQAGQYGEMRPLIVEGRRGAAVYIRPDTDALGPDIGSAASSDPLYRDTVVYLTCLHELGHALGLAHTDQYADIMFFFGYGGDIENYFGRYRRRLAARSDIENTSGLSAGDRQRLAELYGAL